MTNKYKIPGPDKAQLDEAIARLDAMDEHIGKMALGGIDVSTMRAQAREQRKQILALRNAFHPGQ